MVEDDLLDTIISFEDEDDDEIDKKEKSDDSDISEGDGDRKYSKNFGINNAILR